MRGPRTKCPLPGQDVPPPCEVPASLSSDGKLGVGPETRLTGHSHAEDGKWPCYVSLLTGLVSKLHFSLLPENAVWKQDYLQVEVLVLVYRMAAEDSVATL